MRDPYPDGYLPAGWAMLLTPEGEDPVGDWIADLAGPAAVGDWQGWAKERRRARERNASTAPPLPPWVREFRRLRRGWDSYDAAPPTEAAIAAAIVVRPETALPRTDGGILCYWGRERFCLEIGPNGEQTDYGSEQAA